jgi:hypothetical protein
MDRFGIMGNILAFIESVAGHWAFWIGLVLMVEPYLEGAFPSVAAWIKQLLVDDRRKRFFRVAGIIALLVAFFQAWNTQYELSQQNADRIAIKALIGQMIKEGTDLLTTYKDSEKQSDADTLTHAGTLWATKTDNLIEDAYGTGVAESWANIADLPGIASNLPTTVIKSAIRNRLHRTNELMDHVEALTVMPGFDPHHYQWRTECPDC